MKQLSRGGLRPVAGRPERLLRQLQAEARAAQSGQPPRQPAAPAGRVDEPPPKS